MFGGNSATQRAALLTAPLPDPLKRYPYSETLTRTPPRSLPAEGNSQTGDLRSFNAHPDTDGNTEKADRQPEAGGYRR